VSMCVRFLCSHNNSEGGYDAHCTVSVVTLLPTCCRYHGCDPAPLRSVRSRVPVFDVLCCRRSVSSKEWRKASGARKWAAYLRPMDQTQAAPPLDSQKLHTYSVPIS
jgi:hypothetical protein